MSSKPPDRFNEDDVRAVIARAIELDARGGMSTTEDLRAIASEIGISRAAMDAALAEHAQRSRAEVSRSAGPTALTTAAIGVPLGVAAGALLGVASPLIGLGALGLMAVGLGASGALVVSLGRQPTVRSFQFRNFLLWAGVTAGGFVSASLFGAGSLPLPGILVGWCMRSWVASSILGSAAVIAVRRAAGGDTDGGARTLDTEKPARNRLVHALQRVAAWVSRHFRGNANRIVMHGEMDAAYARAGCASAYPPHGLRNAPIMRANCVR